MGLFQKIFGAFSSKPPEDYYKVTLSETNIVKHVTFLYLSVKTKRL